MLTLAKQLERDRASFRLQADEQHADDTASPESKIRRVPIECNSQGQVDFLTDVTTDHLAAVGGIGSGKSWSLSRYIALKMRREAGRATVGAIVANTYKQLETATLPLLWELFEQWGMEEDRDYVYYKKPRWGGFKSRFKKHSGVLSVREWGQAIVASLDDPDSARGPTLGWVAGDELRDWDPKAFPVLLGRLRCPRCSHVEFRGSTSPDGFNWIYNEFVDSAEKHGAMRRMITLRTIDNKKNLAKGYYEMLKASYDKRFAEQELEGKIVSLTSGMVFYAFNRAVNRKPVLPIIGERLLVSFDFNRTPFTVLIGQKVRRPGRPDGDDLHILDEVRMDNAGTPQVCEEIFARLAGLDQTAEIHVFGDASGGWIGNTNSNVSDYQIITEAFEKRYGSRFNRRWPDANPEIQKTVSAVNGLCENANGVPRLFVHPRCESLVKDLEQVKYLKGSKQIDKTDKDRTHAGDALRYLVNEEFPLPSSSGSGLVVV